VNAFAKSLSDKDHRTARKKQTRAAHRGLCLGCWSAALLLPLVSVRGQEALTSAVSLDKAVAVPTNDVAVQPASGIQIGPAQLGLGFVGSTTYNDNINSSQFAPEADILTELLADIQLDWAATYRSDLHLDTGIGYLYYAHYRNNNGLVISPDSALTYAVSWDDLTVTFYDQLSYTREVSNEAALSNISTLPRLDNVSGVRAEYDPGKWTFQASYSHDEYITDASTEYLNHSSEYFFGRIGRFIAPLSQFGMEVSESLTSYEVPSEPNSDNFSIGVYAELQLLSSLQLTVRGGPSIDHYMYPPGAGEGNSTLTSYYFTVSLTHQLTDYLSQSLEIDRSTQLGLAQGTAYIQQLSASYSLSYNASQFISLNGTLTVEDGSQPYTEYVYIGPYQFPSGQGTENYTRYGVGLSAAWQMTKHWSANISLNRWQRNSNLLGDTYNENSVAASINYTF